jgi:hypothetical protein
MIVNNEMGGMWKETVTPYVKVMYQNLPGGDDVNHTKTAVSQDSWPLGGNEVSGTSLI